MSMASIIAASRRRFNPLSLSPALWLDASDASTLFDATSGGSLVAADGAVARWEDKSGNSRHATQATSASRPLRKTSVQNGRDVVRFNGEVNGHILSTSWTPDSNNSICIVTTRSAQTNDASSILRPLVSSLFNETEGFYIATNRENASNPYIARLGFILQTAIDTAQNTFTNSNPSIISGIVQSTGSSTAQAQISLNGTTVGPETRNTNRVGEFDVGGARASSVRRFAGDMAEILVFPTALSTTDRQKVERYLASKWGITLS